MRRCRSKQKDQLPLFIRARILSLRNDGLLQVFYVDYGDVAIVSDDQVRRLRQDFASEIPFQAVECLIAHIEPLKDEIKNFIENVLDDVESLPTRVNGQTSDVDSDNPNSVSLGVNGAMNSEIKKSDSVNGGVWTDDALDFVDQVTQNARWVLLYAKIVGHAQDPKDGKKIPLIDLVDTNGEFDVNIARSIVQAGHAVWRES